MDRAIRGQHAINLNALTGEIRFNPPPSGEIQFLRLADRETIHKGPHRFAEKRAHVGMLILPTN